MSDDKEVELIKIPVDVKEGTLAQGKLVVLDMLLKHAETNSCTCEKCDAVKEFSAYLREKLDSVAYCDIRGVDGGVTH